MEDLLTSRRFKRNTFAAGSRNRIALIDDALDEWHMKKNENEKIKLQSTIRVYKECRRWLKAKVGKDSRNSRKRRAEITKLLAAAIKWMHELDPALGKAFNLYQDNKYKGKKHGKTKSLAGVYQHERKLYLENNKKRAPSATLLDGKFKVKQLGGQNGLPQEFQQLSEAQFRQLDAMYESKLNVLYKRKMSRLRDMLIVSEGKLMTIEDLPYSTECSGHQFQFPFVIDKYGNFYSCDQENQRDGKGDKAQFNHSSFTSGKEVLCAGMVKVDKGVLTLISNNSGHYRPNASHLKNAIQQLEADGVDLSQCRVEYHDFVSNPGYWQIWEFAVERFKPMNPSDPQGGELIGDPQKL